MSPKILPSAAVLIPLALLLACGESGGEDTPTPEASPTTYTLNFKGLINGEAFACGQSYEGVGATETVYRPTDFRLYVHDVTLIDDAGNEAALALEQDGKWQYESLALLDFEDGTATCEAGTADLNAQIIGDAPEGPWTAVRFTLGVPFELNHGDAATAPSPLNLTSLFWSWNGGYKFIRADGRTEGLSDGVLLHLGSTGCDGDGEGNVTACTSQNRATYTLTGFDPDSSTIAVDLGRLYASSDLDTNTAETAPGCMSAQSDPECAPIFEALGLDFAGTAGDPSQQRLFSVE